MISKLINRGDKESQSRHQLHLLAVACLEASVELEPKLKTLVRNKLRRLVPPRNFTEAKALASAGELAIPFLKFRPDRGVNAAAASVRSLMLIGGDSALKTLESYASDQRDIVKAELGRGWNIFNRDEYIKRILSKSNSLNLNRPSSLDGIEGHSSLRFLDIINASHVYDLSVLCDLHLRSLRIRNSPYLHEIEPLANIRTLETLSLELCPILRDLKPLVLLTNLHTLNIVECPNLKDISPLSKMTSLTRLMIINGRFSDSGPISNLSNLNMLDLTGCKNIRNLEFVSELTKLTGVTFSRCNIEDFAPLLNLPKLIYIETDVPRDKLPRELVDKLLHVFPPRAIEF